MPTIATSNPTLTMTALTFWAAENLLADFAADDAAALALAEAESAPPRANRQ